MNSKEMLESLGLPTQVKSQPYSENRGMDVDLQNVTEVVKILAMEDHSKEEQIEILCDRLSNLEIAALFVYRERFDFL